MDRMDQTPVEAHASTPDAGASEVRRRMLSVLELVHHHLRTPLTRVAGLSELMLESSLGDEQREWAGEIRSSAQLISEGLDEALSLLELEAGRWDLERRPFSLSAVLALACRTVNLSVHERGNRVQVIEGSGIPDLLLGDAPQLERSLVHLIAWVSRQFEGETIILRLGLKERTKETVRILFELGPEGPSAVPLAAVLKASIDLAFATALVKAMGGRVIDPNPGDPQLGLRISIPFSVGPDPGPSADQGALSYSMESDGPGDSPSGSTLEKTPETLRILVAEDDRVIQILTRKFLEMRGHQVQVVSNGQEAVEAVRQRVFDVVLMDLEMPELDGISAAREIRSAARGSGPPIIAYTAHALAEVRARCRDAGMDGFLAKPVSCDELCKEVERWPHRSDG